MSDTDDLVVRADDGRPVIDFDHHSAAYRDHWQDTAARFHATGSPIAWSEHHGGFWVTASWEAVQRVAEDWETFTSVNDLGGAENGGRGQLIPQAPYRLYLGESDPPFHTERRRLEAPFFTPKALRKWGPLAQGYLDEALDALAGRDRAELIDDILVPATARTTLHILGYDADDWQDAAAAAHAGSYRLPDQPGYPHEEQARMRANFREALVQRGENPTGDIISALANGTVQGEPLGLDAGESMMNALVFGGFDTTVSLAASALIHLAQHPDEAERVRTDQAYRKNAVEELLRYFPPAAGIARTAVRDTELLGQPIARGERVYMWLAGANRDPLKFPDPAVLDLGRANARDHVAFSAGHHRCLGSPLAKVELDHILATVLTRLPGLRIDPGAVVGYPDIGGVRGFIEVPVTFSPDTATAGV
ncbi:cytochrome P450 [Streptomyces sp. MNU77]|uniref:cytochrome P450 n=1 Tax=Streptomyces sp. MNU77 TaxID=1573406 RepID=UPI0005DDCE13|nr:cytochrome P450 [Streptomyces sp. MNU77]OLO25837.1 cytochrome P450 [Streptomyces sp. MNU77]